MPNLEAKTVSDYYSFCSFFICLSVSRYVYCDESRGGGGGGGGAMNGLG